MTASSVTIRVDSETKKEAARIAGYLGFGLSSVTRAFYKQTVCEHRIPLDLSDSQPNAESLASIKEADRIIAEGRPGYGSACEMFASMGL